MFGVTDLVGFGGTGIPVGISNTANDSSDTDLTIYTFSTQSLGVAADDRRVVVTAAATGASETTPNISSATIGGISATVILEVNNDHAVATLLIADVPTGTTGDVVITYDQEVNRCIISVYRVVGIASNTPFDTASDTTHSSDIVSASIDVPSNGGVIGVVHGRSGSSVTWAGLTEDSDVVVELSNVSSASIVSQSTLTASATFAATPTLEILAVASWTP